MKLTLACVLASALCARPAIAQPGGQGAQPVEPGASAETPLAEAPVATAPVGEAPVATAIRVTTWAVGIATSWASRRDYGNVSRSNFMPELTVQHYRPVAEHVFLRPGLRLAYAGLVQAEMPRDLQVKERDVSLRAELAALHDGPVVPMFSIGAGLILRSVKLASSGVVSADFDPVSRVDVLPEFSVKTGLGIPFLRSALLLEPHVGMRLVLGDEREGIFYGVDLTYAWP